MERSDGISGIVVVRQSKELNPNKDFYDYDQTEHQLLITDWTNVPTESLSMGLRSIRLAVDSILVNGQGTYIDPISGVSTIAPVAVVYCEHDKRYRFRLINAASQLCPMEFCVS